MMCVEETNDLRERCPEKVGLNGRKIGGGKRGGILNRVWKRDSDRGWKTVVEA